MRRQINDSEAKKLFYRHKVGTDRRLQSRVKIGNQVFVTGTVATDEAGNAVAPGDMYAQAKQALGNIERVLQRAGASMKDVVRTRMFVTDISRWEEVGRAHGEYFKAIRPCTTMVEVSKLIAPEYLVEIEADAVIS